MKLVRIVIFAFLCLQLNYGYPDQLYDVHAPLPDSISWIKYKGEDYQQFIVRKSDPPQPQWGDGNKNQLRKRAQLVPINRTALNSVKNISFHFLIPDEWKISEQPVMLAGGHTVNLASGPWSIYIDRNKIWFRIAVDNPNGRLPDENGTIYTAYETKVPFEIDHLYEFKLEMLVTKDMTGYAKAYLDGKQFVDYQGPTVSTNESGLPYDKIGPYVFSKNSQWPHPGESHKRVLMRMQ